MLIPQFANTQAVLFDFDGTLVDSVPDLAHALDDTLAKYGLARVGVDTVRNWVGRGAWRLVHQAFEGQADEATIESAYADFQTQYAVQCTENLAPYEGVINGLAKLATAYPLALVTNKPMQFVTPMLQGLELDFAVVLGGDSVPNKKPAPDMLVQACDVLGVQPSQCLMVGDSSNDSDAAQALNMPVALHRHGYNHGQAVELANPDFIYDRFEELFA